MSANNPLVYTQKHSIGIPDFSSTNLLVVGDVMLDKYYEGDSCRISPEAPVPVVNVNKIKYRPGGAANVALNAAMLGAKVTLIGIVGRDEASQQINKALKSLNVKCHLIQHDEVETITKLRVLSRNQQLIRLDFEQSFEGLDKTDLIRQYVNCLDTADAIVFSDYAKGTLSDICNMIASAKRLRKPIIVDPKGPDYSKYAGATVITPNLKEFHMAVGETESEHDIHNKALELCDKYNFHSVLLTRSERGMTLYTSSKSADHDSAGVQATKGATHFPAIAKEVYDVTGAGDTVVSTLSCAIAVGTDLAHASSLANHAASIVVSKLGTSSVTTEELAKVTNLKQSAPKGTLAEQELLQVVKQAKALGEKVVMTNGCFDILHSGHVRYLEQASQLGDRLIVAVNCDSTVEKLKGKGRPINTASRRMSVLSALVAVDWVVEFVEDTPERLISEVLPNVLVKGGDYIVDEIAGAKQVLENGGQVFALDYEDGISTTDIITRIIQPN